MSITEEQEWMWDKLKRNQWLSLHDIVVSQRKLWDSQNKPRDTYVMHLPRDLYINDALLDFCIVTENNIEETYCMGVKIIWDEKH